MVTEVKTEVAKPKPESRKLSFKEKRELELLEKEMPELERAKAELETTMSTGTQSFEELQQSGARIAAIAALLEEKGNALAGA